MSGRSPAVLLGAASRICLKQPATSLGCSYLAFSQIISLGLISFINGISNFIGNLMPKLFF